MSTTYLTQIGESLHASISKTAAAMKAVLAEGKPLTEAEGEAKDYLVGLIEGQVEKGADFVAVNVDIFGEDDPALAVKQIGDYVRLVRDYSGGVPVCVDSSDPAVLEAGLRAWYDKAEGGIEKPLINSLKTTTMEKLLKLNATMPYAFIGMLVDDELSADTITVDRMWELARELHEAGVKAGIGAEDMYFDTTVYPLAIDVPMTPGATGYTYRAFETIKKIKNDPALVGVHCTLGISNCCQDLPGRKIGICRAYAALAREYGLDTAIVNVGHNYGEAAMDDELLALVRYFALQDGSSEASMRAMEAMGGFCAAQRKS